MEPPQPKPYSPAVSLPRHTLRHRRGDLLLGAARASFPLHRAHTLPLAPQQGVFSWLGFVITIETSKHRSEGERRRAPAAAASSGCFGVLVVFSAPQRTALDVSAPNILLITALTAISNVLVFTSSQGMGIPVLLKHRGLGEPHALSPCRTRAPTPQTAQPRGSTPPACTPGPQEGKGPCDGPFIRMEL